MRVAVVGAGPAGFYAAGRLLDSELAVEVDLFERLPTPWGLVRLGVAPDHPKIKSVSRVFEAIANQPGFRFLGNVEVGRDLSHADLTDHYDAVVYAVGAEADRPLAIPGERLPGSWPARAFVAWYNGHPDYADLEFDLSHERAVVVGNGNVALDVARMLAIEPAILAVTDVADHALDALARSSIREIVVLGRRGPAQASFTNPELRELAELDGVGVVVDPADLPSGDPDDPSARRNVETLRQWAASPPADTPRRIVLRFCCSPVALTGTERVEGVELVRNALETHADGTVVAVPTDVCESLPCGLVLRSVGYRGVPLPDLPFDERSGTIPNERGRIAPGMYCTGWIKRGPSGIIGTNKKDATETVDELLADARAARLPTPAHSSREAIDALLASRGIEVVDEAGWQRIDAVERSRGEPQGRPRIKLATWDALLAAAHEQLLAVTGR
jgi:ferredoxin--NADP+ reductase